LEDPVQKGNALRYLFLHFYFLIVVFASYFDDEEKMDTKSPDSRSPAVLASPRALCRHCHRYYYFCYYYYYYYSLNASHGWEAWWEVHIASLFCFSFAWHPRRFPSTWRQKNILVPFGDAGDCALGAASPDDRCHWKKKAERHGISSPAWNGYQKGQQRWARRKR